MSTTKAKLLKSLPGFENKLSPEGREALFQALQKENRDSFIVGRSRDSAFATLKKAAEDSGAHCVALSDADAAVFFDGWENNPFHTALRNEGISMLPMLIVHEVESAAVAQGVICADLAQECGNAPDQKSFEFKSALAAPERG